MASSSVDNYTRPISYDHKLYNDKSEHQGHTFKVAQRILLHQCVSDVKVNIETRQQTANKDFDCLDDSVICILGIAMYKQLIKSSTDAVYAKFGDNKKRCCTKKDVGDPPSTKYMTLPKYMARGNGITSANGGTEESKVVDLGKLIKEAPVFFRNNYCESKGDYEGNPTLHFKTFEKNMEDNLSTEVIRTNQTKEDVKICNDYKMNPKVIKKIDEIVSQNLALLTESANRVNDNYKWFNADELQQDNLKNFIICLKNDKNIKSILEKLNKEGASDDNRVYRCMATDMAGANYLNDDGLKQKLLPYLTEKDILSKSNDGYIFKNDDSNMEEIFDGLATIIDTYASVSKDKDNEIKKCFYVLANILRSYALTCKERAKIILSVLNERNLIDEIDSELSKKCGKTCEKFWGLSNNLEKKIGKGFELERRENNDGNTLTITRAHNKDVVDNDNKILMVLLNDVVDIFSKSSGLNQDALVARLLKGPINKKEAVKYKKLTESTCVKGNGGDVGSENSCDYNGSSVILKHNVSKEEMLFDDGNQKNSLSNIKIVKKQNTEAVARKVEEAIKVTFNIEKPHNENDPKERLTKPVHGMNIDSDSDSDKNKFTFDGKEEKNKTKDKTCKKNINDLNKQMADMKKWVSENSLFTTENTLQLGEELMCMSLQVLNAIGKSSMASEYAAQIRKDSNLKYVLDNIKVFNEIANINTENDNVFIEYMTAFYSLLAVQKEQEKCENLKLVEVKCQKNLFDLSQAKTDVNSLTEQHKMLTEQMASMSGDIAKLRATINDNEKEEIKYSENINSQIEKHSGVDQNITECKNKIDRIEKNRNKNNDMLQSLAKEGIEIADNYENSSNKNGMQQINSFPCLKSTTAANSNNASSNFVNQYKGGESTHFEDIVKFFNEKMQTL